MARASKVCADVHCPNVAVLRASHCAEHTPKAWAKDTTTVRISGRRSQRRRRYVLSRDNGICWICGHPGATVADHVVPLAEGGADTIDNLRAAHDVCNTEKGQREAQRGRARRETGR